MHTHLATPYQDSPDGATAAAILRKCVHCGFCTATCPTYQLLGDELDGPRGRIYLIKQVLEGEAPTRKTQMHLDRCLTCRSCESTCPSGVDYGHLLDIGRKLVEDQVGRAPLQQALRWVLKEGLPSPLFGPAMKLGQWVRPLLPAPLKAKVPERQAAGSWPKRVHARKVLLLAGCVQPTMAPSIDAATARVLDAAGVQCLVAPKSGCCGAVKFHLNDQEGGKAQMRANIDAWWPYLRGQATGPGVEAIIMNASGCGVTVKEYAHFLADEPRYAAKAARVSELTRDLSEWLPELSAKLAGKLDATGVARVGTVAFHPPCSLQHGQQLRGGVEHHLQALGLTIRVTGAESHLCCGSAGTYSVLNPELAYQLRDRKLTHLGSTFDGREPDVIVSANMGCISHLQSGTRTPVRHWIELLDDLLVRTL